MSDAIESRMFRRPLAAVAILLAALVAVRAHAEKLAITFDDLPLNGELAPGTTRAGIVRDVLQILNDRHVPQVYGFINAAKLEGNPDGAEALRLWVAGGERVGNHTYTHFDLTGATPEAFLRNTLQNEPALELLDAGDNWHWFRYPYLHEGDRLVQRRAVRAQLKAQGYRTAQVTLDYEDYLWNSAYAHCVARPDAESIDWLRTSYLSMAASYLDADRQMAQQVFGHPINHVLLLHLGAFSSTILPSLLDLLEQKGFTLVTLEEAQSDPAYDTDPDGVSKEGGTLLEQWMDVRKLKYPPVPKKPYKTFETLCRPAGGGAAAGP